MTPSKKGKTRQQLSNVPTRRDTLAASAHQLLDQIQPAAEGGSTSAASVLTPSVSALKVSTLGLSVYNTYMLKRLNQDFANNIIHYEVSGTHEKALLANKAINQYLQDGVIPKGNSTKPAIQPLIRLRLLLRLGSVMGYNVRDTTYGERTSYSDELGSCLGVVVKDLMPWYSPAREVSTAILSSQARLNAKDPSIWKRKHHAKLK